MVNTKVTKDEILLVHAITKRAQKLNMLEDDFLSHMMDLEACHANGMPLKLQEMLDGDLMDFAHDFNGIHRHINRTTGKIENCFVPRFAV